MALEFLAWSRKLKNDMLKKLKLEFLEWDFEKKLEFLAWSED